MVNTPYSDAAEAIGYESRYIAQNLGSVFLYIVAAILVILIFALAKCCSSNGGKINTLVRSKLSKLFWADFTDFLNEVYLPMSYLVCINCSALGTYSSAVFFMSAFAFIMGFILVFWPIYVANQVNSAMKKKPDYPLFLRKLNENKEGGEEIIIIRSPNSQANS